MTSFDEHDQRARAQKYKQYAVAQLENALHTKPQVVATHQCHLDALLDPVQTKPQVVATHQCHLDALLDPVQTKPQALVFSFGSLPQY